jgi:hypothetical protein
MQKVLRALPQQRTDPAALEELKEIVEETRVLRQAANNKLL